MLYFGLDGDSIGRVIESYLIENEEEKLVSFSAKIVQAIEEIKAIALEKSAKIIFCTGDSILIQADLEPSFGQEMVQLFKEKTQRTASVGIGETTATVYLGLKIAKSRGGEQAVHYK